MSSFSFTRLLSLLWFNLKTNSTLSFMTSLIVLFIFLICHLTHLPEEVIVFIFGMFWYFSSANTFQNYCHSSALLNMSLPSHPLEKFLERWLYGLIILPIMLLVLYHLAYFCAVAVHQSTPYLIKPVLLTLQSFNVQALWLTIVIFITGSIYYKNKPNLKTSLALLILTIFTALLLYILSSYFEKNIHIWGSTFALIATSQSTDQNLSTLEIFNNVPTYDLYNPALMQFYGITFDFAFVFFSILLIVLSWFSFREHELRS